MPRTHTYISTPSGFFASIPFIAFLHSALGAAIYPASRNADEPRARPVSCVFRMNVLGSRDSLLVQLVVAWMKNEPGAMSCELRAAFISSPQATCGVINGLRATRCHPYPERSTIPVPGTSGLHDRLPDAPGPNLRSACVGNEAAKAPFKPAPSHLSRALYHPTSAVRLSAASGAVAVRYVHVECARRFARGAVFPVARIRFLHQSQPFTGLLRTSSPRPKTPVAHPRTAIYVVDDSNMASDLRSKTASSCLFPPPFSSSLIPPISSQRSGVSSSVPGLCAVPLRRSSPTLCARSSFVSFQNTNHYHQHAVEWEARSQVAIAESTHAIKTPITTP
ncbi:hypothetical protein C8R44DRAFT_891760 [Mycena epipterygia]|nr:hypothetical protein C8R44DRAFT_891760 [Mycena epipterygia]